jgi:CAAX protease family protein
MVISGIESRLLLVAGTFGPLATALLLTELSEGHSGLRALLDRFLIWRVNVGWYLWSLVGSAVVVLAAIAIHLAAAGDTPAWNDPRRLYLVIPAFLYVLIFSVLGEEAGWRGFALPRLQERFGSLGASLIIGIGWGTWHLPLFWIAGNFHQQIPLSLFLLQDIALSILLTWLYNSTGGSLLLVHLFHAASNTTLGVLPVLPTDTAGVLRPLWIAVGLLWIVTIVIVIATGGRLVHRQSITAARSGTPVSSTK